jgi:hypothetical protein
MSLRGTGVQQSCQTQVLPDGSRYVLWPTTRLDLLPGLRRFLTQSSAQLDCAGQSQQREAVSCCRLAPRFWTGITVVQAFQLAVAEAERDSILAPRFSSARVPVVAARAAQSVTASGQPGAAAWAQARIPEPAASGKAEPGSASVRPRVQPGQAACPETVEGTVGGHARGRGTGVGLRAGSQS